MLDQYNEVLRWNVIFGHISDDTPERWESDAEYRNLAIDLIQEEVDELNLAVHHKDKVETLDAVLDILVTTFGLAGKASISPELLLEGFNEVMRANWSKADKDGNPVYLPSGKIGKSDLYVAPNLHKIVEKETPNV